MPKQVKDQENPYIGHITMAVSDGKQDYTREELGEKEFQRFLVRGALAAMFHLHDIGMFDADIGSFKLKPDKP